MRKSSSGGVFSLIANYVLEQAGSVYGAAFDGEMKLSHIRVSKKDELHKLRGSKYLQSDTKNIYSKVRTDLKQDKFVYFTGTPCQVAALKLYLRKDYSQLITSEFICHGTPSQKIFSNTIAEIEKERKGKVTGYNFRDKYVGGWGCSSSSFIQKKTGLKYLKYDGNMQTYFDAFIAGHISNSACYSCPYATPRRVGDVTLADYWDIDKLHPEIIDTKDGFSLILLNTVKGQDLFLKLKEQIRIYPSNLECAIKGNYNLSLATPLDEPAREETLWLVFNNYSAFKKKYLPKACNSKIKFYLRFYIRNSPILFYVKEKIKKIIK